MKGQTTRYQGSVTEPIPGAPGFSMVPWDDEGARMRCQQIAQASDFIESGGHSGTLGAPPVDDVLPVWTFRDELLPSGLYRIFHYEHPTGRRGLSALRFEGTWGGESGTLGAAETSPTQGTDTTATNTTASASTTDQNLSNAANAINSFVSGGGNLCDVGAAGATVKAFQTAWNATTDGNMGTPKLAVDGEFGTQSSTAYNQATGNASGTVAACTSFSNVPGATTSAGASSGNSSEPTPAATSACTWTADATNAQINGIAQTIVNSNTPTPWVDQMQYATQDSSGGQWTLVGWYENGTKMVAAWRCLPVAGSTTSSPAATTSSGSTALWVALGAAAAGVAAIAGIASHKTIKRRRAARRAPAHA